MMYDKEQAELATREVHDDSRTPLTNILLVVRRIPSCLKGRE
jgi:hypothetical protein